MPDIQLTLNQMVAIKRWTNALREGKHERGSIRLKSGNKFCAVGVGCDVNGFHDIETNSGDAWRFLENISGIVGFVDDPALCFGMRHDNDNRILFYGIARMNDCGESWSSIADRIEHDYLPNGFTIPTSIEETKTVVGEASFLEAVK